MRLGVPATFLFCLLAPSAMSQSIYDTYSGFTVPTRAVLPATEHHPSLWFDVEQLTGLQQKKTTDPYLGNLWSQISSSIQSFKGKSASSQNTSNLPRMARYCAFGWIISSDSVARQRALDALLLAYQNVPRTASPANFDNEYDEIYRATWLQNFCCAYDWIAPTLTRQQDSLIRARLLWETVLLRNHMVDSVRYAPRPHNHRSKPAYAIGTAALTFSGDPRSPEWLEFSLRQQNSVTHYQFSADGIYREGPHYFVYTLVNAIPFLWQYLNVSGVDLFPYFTAAFEYPVRVRNAKGWLPSIEDSYVKPFPSHMVAGAYRTTPTMLHSVRPLSNVLQWNWFTTSFFTTNYTGATNDVTWDIDEFLCYDPTIPQAVPDISPMQQLDCGEVVFRSNDSYASAPDRYLLFHGVAEGDNHQHPDALSYVLDWKGTPLAVDPGYGADGFSDPNRAWYISAAAHNLVTVNGSAPLDFDVNKGPVDRQFLSSKFFDFAEKEAKTAAPDGRLRRGIAFIGKEYWAVYDVSTASASASYSLNIHGRGALSQSGPFTTWTTTTDTYGKPARLSTLVLTSGPSSTSEQSGTTSLFKDEVAQRWISTTQRGDSVTYLHLLYPDDVGNVLPVSVQSTDSNALRLELIRQTERSTFVVLCRTTLTAAGKGLSDSRFTWFQERSDSLVRFAVCEGRSFSWAGISFLTSDSMLTMAADYSKSESTSFCFGRGTRAATVQVRPFTNSRAVHSVTFNGTPVLFSLTGDGRIRFRVDSVGVAEVLPTIVSSLEEKLDARPSRFHLSAGYPNPFNPVITIQFSLDRTGQTTLRVFSALGRCVRTLVDRTLTAGHHQALWNGRDDSGLLVTSGIYLFELRQGNLKEFTKGVLLK